MEVADEGSLICRTCLSEDQEMTLISSTQRYGIEKMTICDIIMKCASIQVRKGDGLPEQVCITCMKELTQAYVFRKLCEKTDSILKVRQLKHNQLSSAAMRDKMNPEHPPQQKNQEVHKIFFKQEPQDFSVESSNLNSSSFENDSDYEDIPETIKIEEERVQINMVTEYTCVDCNVTYDGMASYQVHLETQHGSLIDCSKCNASFTSEILLKSHSCFIVEAAIAETSTVNGDCASKTCSVCNMTFRSSELMLAHKEKHSTNRPFACNICGKRFIKSDALRLHNTVHTGEKPYKCTECESCYTSVSSLIRHKRTHTGDTPYECEHCGKRFARPSSYTVHLRTHTGEKPLQCKVCSKRFSQRGHLQSHMFVHTGEKPFACELCGYGFTSKSKLKKHMMRHMGLRPYKCEVCGRAFGDPSNKRAHMRIHSK